MTNLTKHEREQFEAELEGLGIEAVRARLELGQFGRMGQRMPLAKEWLYRAERARTEGSESAKNELTREQIRIARSAKNTAVAAAAIAIAVLIANIVMFVISIPRGK